MWLSFVLAFLLRPVALSGVDAAAGQPFAVQPVAAGVFAFVRSDPAGLMVDGNSGFIVGDDGVLVVDAPVATADVLAAIRRVTDKPVTTVVNTHWHDDHVIGNALYRDAFPRVEFIAHDATRAYLPGPGLRNRQQMLTGAPPMVAYMKGLLARGESMAGGALDNEERISYASDIALAERYLTVVPTAAIVLPTLTTGGSLTLWRGGREIQIRALGGGHTAGDIVVWLPRERVLFSGDLVICPVPLIGAEQSHIGAWAAGLQEIVALKPALIVPGHGPLLRDDSYPRRLAALLAEMGRQVAAAASRGETLEQVRRSVDLGRFRAEFAGASKLRRFLFDTYVSAPGVAAAYREAVPAR